MGLSAAGGRGLSVITCLGFDFGMRHIGVAVGRHPPRSSRGLTVLRADGGVPDWAALDALVAEWRPDVLVVGWPWDGRGEWQPLLGHVKGFVRQLRRRYSMPVETVDERHTTQEARAQLFDEGGLKALQKRQIDLHCAQQLCEQWLLVRGTRD